jgi:hypothetical protein
VTLQLLFFLRSKNYDRLFEAVFDELLRRGHHVHVAFEVERDARFAASAVFDALSERHNGRLTYGPAPAQAGRVAAVLSRQLRLTIDYLRYLTPEYAAATALRGRARERTWPWLVAAADRAPARRPRGRPLLDRALRSAIRRLPIDPATLGLIAGRAPDVVVVSPLLELGATQGRHVRAARALEIPSAVVVASWDNLTNKGVILDVPDLVVVWNDDQIGEAARLHQLPAARVVATGAAVYDQWFGREPTATAEAFRRKVGLDEGRPYILYACSSRFIAGDEQEFVADWLRRLRASTDPLLRDAGVLIRPHPANAQIWHDSDLEEPGSVVIHPRDGEVPRQDPSKADYFDSIHHARAVVAINTSAIVESAIVGRPAFTVLTDRYRPTQGGTLHFSRIDARHGGPLSIAESFDEHLAQLAGALADGAPVQRLDDFVERFARPHGVHQPAAPLVAAALESLAGSAARRPSIDRAPAPGGPPPSRMLWVLDHPGLLMHFDATLAALTERGHDVRVAFGRPSRHATALDALEGAVAERDPVPRRRGASAPAARQLRAALDALHYLDPGLDGATFARRRWARDLSTPVWMRALAPLLAASPSSRELLREALTRAELALPIAGDVDRWLAERSPDLVVVSPLVQRDAHQVDIVAAARARGIPTVLAVASWDNLSSKGALRVIPDRVTVWNEDQRREASVLHRVAPGRLSVTGAQPFDRWFDRAPTADRASFCASVGLAADRPFVLWACSTRQYRPERDEIEFVRRWVAALRAAPDERTRELGVLVRPHPTTVDAWADIEIEGAAIWRRERALPITLDERGAYFDALFHAGAVAGINSSAMVEAAIVGRPVHTIRRPQWAAMQDELLHFRYLMPEHGGFLRVAEDLDEHVRLLAEDLASPTAWRPAQERFVARFVRPLGIRQAATPLLVQALEEVAASSRPAAPPAGGARVLRALLLTAGGGRLAVSGVARAGATVRKLGQSVARS